MFGGGVSASTTTSSASGSSAGSENIRRLSTDDENYVRDMMRQFGAGATTRDMGEARQQALQDVQGSVEALFAQFRDTSLPQILTQQNMTGGYSGTTSQMLMNDGFARTVAQGAALQLDAVNQYETRAQNQNAQNLQGFGMSLEALLQASQQTDTESSFKTKSKSSTVSASASFGF